MTEVRQRTRLEKKKRPFMKAARNSPFKDSHKKFV